MKISVEEISSVKKSVRIELPQELVAKELNHAVGHLQSDIRLPGFRPGKVPLAVLKKKFEEELQAEVLKHLLQEYCQQGIKEAGFASMVVGSPEVRDIDFKWDAPLFFTVVIDVVPRFELANYTGLTPPAKEILITENDVEQGLQLLQRQQRYLENLPDDHSIALSDYATIDFAMNLDGKPLKGAQRQDYNLQVGSKTFRPEVEDALLGKKKGDTVSVDLAIPADDPDKQFAGKKAGFKIEIKGVKAEKFPLLDDEFAKDVGLSSLSELKESVKAALFAERNDQMKQDQKNTLVNKLIDLHPIEVPQTLIAREWESLAHAERISEQSDPERYQLLEPHAVRRAKASIILSAIADQEKIEVLKPEMENAVKQLVKKTGVSVAEGKDMMQNPRILRGLEEMIREEKALERVYSLSECEIMKESVAC